MSITIKIQVLLNTDRRDVSGDFEGVPLHGGGGDDVILGSPYLSHLQMQIMPLPFYSGFDILEKSKSVVDGIHRDARSIKESVDGRITDLNYQDKEILAKQIDLSKVTRKVYLPETCTVTMSDRVRFEGQEYEVVSLYKVRGKLGSTHHFKLIVTAIDG